MDTKQKSIVYNQHNSPVSFQAETGEAVTASDTKVLQTGILFIGTGGDVKVHTKQGAILLFKNIADATFLPIAVDMVYNTDTTADDIIILR